MADKHPKTSRPHRFFGWFSRHKITAVFTMLILAVALYSVGSWVVLQVQIHFERERFMAAKELVAYLGDNIGNNKSAGHLYPECSYTDNGAVFATRFLGCEVNADINFPNATVSTVNRVSHKLQTELRNKGLSPHENIGGMGKYDLSNYVFKYKSIACGFSTTYYTNITPPSERYSEAIQNGNDLYINIGCSGATRAEYFPVVNY